MDKTTLVRPDLQAGRDLIEKLEGLGITIDVAVWLQDDETGIWHLALSSPALTKPGSKRVYDAVISVLGGLHNSDLDLDNVRILSPNDGLIEDLRSRIRTSDDLRRSGLTASILETRPSTGLASTASPVGATPKEASNMVRGCVARKPANLALCME